MVRDADLLILEDVEDQVVALLCPLQSCALHLMSRAGKSLDEGAPEESRCANDEHSHEVLWSRRLRLFFSSARVYCTL